MDLVSALGSELTLQHPSFMFCLSTIVTLPQFPVNRLILTQRTADTTIFTSGGSDSSGIKGSYEKSLQYTIRWIFSRMQGSGLWMWCCFDRPATVSNVPVSNVDRCLPVFSKRRWFNGAISGQRPQSRKTGFKLVQCTSTSHMTTESIHLGWLELNRLSSRL